MSLEWSDSGTGRYKYLGAPDYGLSADHFSSGDTLHPCCRYERQPHGKKYSMKRGKTPVLAADEARQLLDSIDTSTVVGLRDRALIALMVYTFARVGAATSMHVEDWYFQGRRWWVRLHEKGGKRHEMPAHHNLEEYLAAYIDSAGIGKDKSQSAPPHRAKSSPRRS